MNKIACANFKYYMQFSIWLWLSGFTCFSVKKCVNKTYKNVKITIFPKNTPKNLITINFDLSDHMTLK